MAIKMADVKKLFSHLNHSSMMAELVICFREIAALYQAGVPFHKSLRIISEQTEHPGLKSALEGCHAKIMTGHNITNALSYYPTIFPELYLRMIEAGEKSGNLDEMLEYIARDAEKRRALVMKLNSILIYPIFIFGICLILLIFAPSFIFNKMFDLFNDMKIALPITTRILIQLSSAIRSPMFPLLVLMTLLNGFALLKICWSRRASRRYIQSLLLTIPGIGTALHVTEVTIFARTMATVLNAGLPLLRSLEIAKRSAGNASLQDKLEVVRTRIISGWPLHKAMSDAHFFPPAMLNLVAAGEESGKLPVMFEWAAVLCEMDLERALDTAISFLQPLTLLIIGLVVGFIIYALMTPMIKIVETLS